MANKTTIEWTDRSANPLRAINLETGKNGTFCVHASPGCDGCYAEGLNRWRGNRLAFIAQNRKRVEFRLNEDELRSWLRLKPGTLVFVCDMCDLLLEDVPEALIDQVFAYMALSPATFQVLTKRAKRLQEYFRDPDERALAIGMAASNLLDGDWIWGPGKRFRSRIERLVSQAHGEGEDGSYLPDLLPLPRVWLGVSVEDQRRADERILLLLETPAAVRFLSVEPLLSAVDLEPYLRTPYRYRGFAAGPDGIPLAAQTHVDWCVVGGESGSGARPCDVAWIRALVAQCQEAGVPCFVKQLGKWINGDQSGFIPTRYLLEDRNTVFVPPVIGPHAEKCPGDAVAFGLTHPKGGAMEEWPADLRVREMPATALGLRYVAPEARTGAEAVRAR